MRQRTSGVLIALLDDAALDACRSIFERFGGKPRCEYFPSKEASGLLSPRWDLTPLAWGLEYAVPSDRIQDACAALVDAIGIVPVITGD
jgi:hypothetical protein